jgi:CrcB protein
MCGTPARYAMERVIHVAPGTFPWSTFTVNVTGCFVLGILLTLIVERWPPSRYVRAFAVIGFLGAYTTFSTYTVEAVTLTKDHHANIAAAYVVASLVAGLLAVAAGVALARTPALRGTNRGRAV